MIFKFQTKMCLFEYFEQKKKNPQSMHGSKFGMEFCVIFKHTAKLN